jgi:hypothetical protein
MTHHKSTFELINCMKIITRKANIILQINCKKINLYQEEKNR